MYRRWLLVGQEPVIRCYRNALACCRCAILELVTGTFQAVNVLLESRAKAVPSDLQVRPDRKRTMAWTTPTLIEICIGLEINVYLPAEF